VSWDPSAYDGVNYIYVSASNVWTPNITLFNPASGSSGSVIFAGSAYLNSSGTVQVLTTVELDTTCNVDLTNFPYDSQICTIRMSDFLYSSSDLVFNVYSANASTGMGHCLSSAFYVD
jgi:hypothetical protein